MIHVIPPFVYHKIQIPDGEKCTYYSVHFDYIDLGRENDFSPEDIYIAACNKDLEIAPVDDTLIKRPHYVIDQVMLPEETRANDPIAYTGLFETIIRLQREKPLAWEIDMKCLQLQ